MKYSSVYHVNILSKTRLSGQTEMSYEILRKKSVDLTPTGLARILSTLKILGKRYPFLK